MVYCWLGFRRIRVTAVRRMGFDRKGVEVRELGRETSREYRRDIFYFVVRILG